MRSVAQYHVCKLQTHIHKTRLHILQEYILKMAYDSEYLWVGKGQREKNKKNRHFICACNMP